MPRRTIATPLVAFPLLLATFLFVLSAAHLRGHAQETPRETPAAEEAEELPAESPAQVQRLVRQLGDESFAQRSAAETQLKEIGLAARAALEAGLSGEDLHTRRTCQRLLNDILESDYQRRFSGFLADVEGDGEHDLPGWRRFRQLVGDSPAVRKLFAEMHQAEGALLISSEAGNIPTAEALKVRLQNVYQLMRLRDAQQRKQPDAATVTALLFVGTDPRLKLDTALANDQAWLQITNSGEYRQAIAEGDKQAAARKVLGRWLLLPGNAQLLNHRLRLANQYGLPEGLTLALDTLENRKGIAPSYVSYALEAIGKLGGKPYAAVIASLLKDEGVISRRRVNKTIIDIQLRDVALGWLVHLTDQDHEDYNFPRAKTIFDRLRQDPAKYSVSYSYLSFESDEKRQQAFAKWNAWVKDHPLPKVPAKQPAEDGAAEDSAAEQAAGDS